MANTEPARPCRDPDCVDPAGRRGVAEPERDGDTIYLQCALCGYQFGFARAVDEVYSDGVCAVGIPEPVRRAASAGALRALETTRLPLLTIGRGPHDDVA